MWVPEKFRSWFEISKDTLDTMREELAVARAEVRLLESQLSSSRANFNWLTTRVNSLEVERAALLEKVTGIKTIVPEVVHAPQVPMDLNSSLFEDLGDKAAKELGLPSYSN